MSFELGTFTGRCHIVQPSDISPNGRVLSIWENSDGGTFYRDLTYLSFLSGSFKKAGNKDALESVEAAASKIQETKRKLSEPKFPF